MTDGSAQQAVALRYQHQSCGRGDSSRREAAWLIDMGYVVKAARSASFKLDYVKARDLLNDRIGPTTVCLFNSYDREFGIAKGLDGFYKAMEAVGMKVRLHSMGGRHPAEHRQRRVDVDLAAHMVWFACQPTTGTIVLTSGDQDFIPAVEMSRTRGGKRFLLFTYESAVSGELKRSVDEHWTFEQFASRLAR